MRARVTLTASLSGGSSPSGTVTFKDGATTLGTETISGSTATFSTSALGVGSHSITAIYAGDSNNLTATSSSVSVTVSRISSSVSLTASGISFGGDYRLTRQLTLGLGAGYSSSRYRADDDSASSNGQGVMGVLYASVRPMDDLYVVAGYGVLHFDLARLISDTGVTANGARGGHQRFGSATLGYEWRGQDWLVSPYVRVDIARASLDRYTESGGPGALTYFSQSVRDDAAYLGLRGEYSVAVPVGVLTPQARIAYQRNLQGAGQTVMTYADPVLSSPVYTYSDGGQESKQWLLTLGGRLALRSGITVTLLYTHNAANATTSSQSLNLSVGGRF